MLYRITSLLFIIFMLSVACGSSDADDDPGTSGASKTVGTCGTDLPTLSPDAVGTMAGYEGTYYEGPLFETSFQMGDGGEDSPDPDTYTALMNRHNIVRAMMMFGLDGEDDQDLDVDGDEGFGYLIDVINKAPCRIIPFFVRGTGDVDSLETGNINIVLSQNRSSFSTGILKGIGELEIYKESWGLLDADNASLKAVYDIAKTEGMNIFSHWAGGQDRVGPEVGLPQRDTSIKDSLEVVLTDYPDVNFIFHLFPTDIEPAVFDLMDAHTNFYFSVDLSHFMQRIPWQCGLLECFSSNSDPAGAFVAEFDTNAQEMLDQAVDRYKTLIEDHPNQFLWGTENVELYDFETAVYDRSVIFTRAFINQLDETVREKFAYQNAEALFGPGVGEISD